MMHLQCHDKLPLCELPYYILSFFSFFQVKAAAEEKKRRYI